MISSKKSLGQNFLRNPHYVRLLADAAHVSKGDIILEAGPGEGVLTHELLSRGAQVIAVEKDRRLIPVLQHRFGNEIASGQLILMEMDILSFEPADNRLTAGGYTLAANIPYYITGAFIRKFLETAAQPSTMAILIQKEVAERIARSKKESLLSLSVKAFGTPRYVKTVPRGAFAPAPRVDSAIVAVTGISRGQLTDAAHEKRFFALIRAGFSSKRKLLASNIRPLLGTRTDEALHRAGIPAKARAEDVSLHQWLALAH